MKPTKLSTHLHRLIRRCFKCDGRGWHIYESKYTDGSIKKTKCTCLFCSDFRQMLPRVRRMEDALRRYTGHAPWCSRDCNGVDGDCPCGWESTQEKLAL